MPIVFSAITPHPPILLPSIGKDNVELLKQTANSFETLKKKLSEKNVETLIVISPHGPINDDIFRINMCPEYTSNFEDFGDFSTKKKWQGDVFLSYQIRKALISKDIINMISEENLDHGLSVPLMLLAENLHNIKIIPMYYSGRSRKEHFEFGQSIYEILQRKRRNIGIIASGDLSHCLTKESPGGFSKKAKKFDSKLVELLQKNKTKEILDLDDELVEEVGECGLKSIMILLGCIERINHKPKLLSYEAPFGVGYLTMDYEI